MSNQIKMPEIKTKEDMRTFVMAMYNMSFNWWLDELTHHSPMRRKIAAPNFVDTFDSLFLNYCSDMKVMNRPFDPTPCIEVILEVQCATGIPNDKNVNYMYLWIQIEPDKFWDFKENMS